MEVLVCILAALVMRQLANVRGKVAEVGPGIGVPVIHTRGLDGALGSPGFHWPSAAVVSSWRVIWLVKGPSSLSFPFWLCSAFQM